MGVVMVNGLPIAHHVFSGDLVDHETVEVVMEDVGKRFEVERVVWVGDRGDQASMTQGFGPPVQTFMVALDQRNKFVFTEASM